MKKIINKILILTICLHIFSCAKDENVELNTSPPIQNNGDSRPGCIAVDTDGDGLIDCEDPDIDNDNFINEEDAFPRDPTEWSDFDGDGVGDNSDRFPLDPLEYIDSDNDSIGDRADPDDDNDGIPDLWEDPGLEFDANAFSDIDFDGLPDQSIDPDNDNDGLPNFVDAFFADSRYQFDTDGDGIPNLIDEDIDNDGALNALDAFPYDSSEQLDTDLDGIGNNKDPDDDGDLIPDVFEEFPLDNNRQYDTDGDGFSNTEDTFPFDRNEWVDSDGDGTGDNGDPFPNNPNEWADTDGDGIGDNSDSDIDGDGFQNCVPLNLEVEAVCNQDAFPFDLFEYQDTDGDGIGNFADPDDDNDMVPDIVDSFPLDRLHFSDNDRDGIPDSNFPKDSGEALLYDLQLIYFVWDPDIDNDGTPNIFDALPLNPFESFDTDGDGIGNNEDIDDDGDGVVDNEDLFPFDSSESGDDDNDGIGNNTDPDDDNDGVPDIADVLPLNPRGFSDINLDGIPDQIANDLDGDGFANGTLECIVTLAVPLTIECKYPVGSPDLFPFDSNENADLDGDGIGNNADPDDDNDGVLDLVDAFTSMTTIGFFDTDGDGIPNNVDGDIDGDGVDQSPNGLECTGTDPIVCDYQGQVCLYNAEFDDILCFNYDFFPFDPTAKSDIDGDGIPDSRDTDIDGDGRTNCIPVDLETDSLCNQDALPIINELDDYVIDEAYEEEGQPPVLYCKESQKNNCYYIDYDDDNDGLTNYEEFLLGTNPDSSDTDGDGVPDLNESLDGTDPLSATSFKDTDNDGIPDFSDPTPRGVFNQTSLEEQISSASQCANLVGQPICVDQEFDLCYWENDIPEVLVQNPLNPTDPNDKVPAGKCLSKDLIVSEDIVMTDCIKHLDGDISIKSSTGERNKLIINQDTLNGANCLTSDAIIESNLDTNLVIKDLDIELNNVDTFIRSLGDSVNINNVGFVSNNDKLSTFVDFNSPIIGQFAMTSSSIRTKTDVPDNYNNLLLINVERTEIITSIFECLYGSELSSMVNDCVDITSRGGFIDGSVFVNQSTLGDAFETIEGSAFRLENSTSLFEIVDSRVYSSTKTYIEEGLSTSILKSNFRLTNFNENGNYNRGTLNTAFSYIVYDSIFRQDSPRLTCVPEVDADFSAIHGAYFNVEEFVLGDMNVSTESIFTNDSINLTPSGSFTTSIDYDDWKNPIYPSGPAAGTTFFSSSGVYDGISEDIKLSQSQGIGQQIILNDKKFIRIRLKIKAENIGAENGLITNIDLYDANDMEFLRTIEISFGSGPRELLNEGLFEKVQYLYNDDFLDITYEIPRSTDPSEAITSIFITIQNPTISSGVIILDDIQVIESQGFNFYYPGIKVPLCSIDDL